MLILGWNYALYPLALLTAVAHRLPVILRGDSVRYRDADEKTRTARFGEASALVEDLDAATLYRVLCGDAGGVDGESAAADHYGCPTTKSSLRRMRSIHGTISSADSSSGTLQRIPRQQLGIFG